MEMFEAFGFVERVLQAGLLGQRDVLLEAGRQATAANIVRSGRIQDAEDGLSEFPHVILNQARVHDFYLDVMRNVADPARAALFTAPASICKVRRRERRRASAYPVTVTARAARCERTKGRSRPSGPGTWSAATARAAPCGRRSGASCMAIRPIRPGASWTCWRHRLPRHPLQVGDPVGQRRQRSSSFRAKAVISFRIYVELDKLSADERVSSLKITARSVWSRPRNAFFVPIPLDVKEIAWWSVYEIGQRLCDKFDDPADDAPQDASRASSSPATPAIPTAPRPGKA